MLSLNLKIDINQQNITAIMKKIQILFFFLFCAIILRAENNIGAQVISMDLDETGIGSSYLPHNFQLKDAPSDISDISWKFSLKDVSGQYVEVKTGQDVSFMTDAVEFSDNLYVNINGDLEGRIDCRYTTAGGVTDAVPYYVSLEMKPVIKSIDDLQVVEVDDTKFYLIFNVSYAGADYVTVRIEDELSPMTTIDDYEEPFVAHIVTRYMPLMFYSWVTISVTNEYGEVNRVLEFAPDFGLDGNLSIENDLCVKNINIYSLTGNKIYEGAQDAFEKSSLSPGVYIVRKCDASGNCFTSKIVVK